MSRRAIRLVVVPAILFAAVSAGVYTLAELHPAKEETDTMQTVVTGDAARGETLFAERCASCHGEGGEGGDVGPQLVGRDVSIGEARATIENGSGVMPPDLVEGQDLEDVLAYLEGIIAG
jgi:mono/diheme cytochrome c family protein